LEPKFQFGNKEVLFLNGETHAPDRDDSLMLPRRRFVQGIAAAGLAILLDGKFNRAGVEAIANSPIILDGAHFDLALTLDWQVSCTGAASDSLMRGSPQQKKYFRKPEGESLWIFC
jgi:hypothetical protein